MIDVEATANPTTSERTAVITITYGASSNVEVTVTQAAPDAPAAPAAPTGLMAVAASGTEIDLSWTTPNNGGSPLTGYTLQYNKTGATAFGESVAGIAADATSYSHTSLDVGTEYTYRLVAINGVGDSGPSNKISATTHNVPDAPTGLMATAVSDTEIDLAWRAPTNDGGSEITSYLLEYSTDEGSTFMELHTTADAVTLSYSHAGLTAGTEYHYRVAAINSIDTGAYASVSVITPLFGAPSGLTAMAVSETQIDLAWQAFTNTGGSAVTGYQVQVSEDGGTTFTDLHTTSNAATLTYEHTGLSAGTEVPLPSCSYQ